MATRTASPVRTTRRAKLELQWAPLWSTNVFDNTTAGALNFFQDLPGQNGTSELDSNMEKPNSLPTPRIFILHGLEIVVNQALASRSSAGDLAGNEVLSNQTSAWFNSIKGLMWTTWLELTIGIKPFVQLPAFAVPTSYTIGGGIVGAAPVAGTFANGLRVLFGASTGMVYSTRARKKIITPDQIFKATLNFPIAGAGAAAAGSGHVVACILQGIKGVEIM